ncbi:hypothetical protein GCM10009674_22300 [Nesterenkonia xinjiangensis]
MRMASHGNASQSTSDVTSDADAGPAGVVLGEDPTALERFIAHQVEPRAEELREVSQVPGHLALLRHELTRRSISIREVGAKNSVLLFGGVVVGGMDHTMTTLVSANARRISRSKALTRRHLELQELPVPSGRTFREDEITEAAKYLGSLPGLGVLKPVTGRSGHGISTHLSNAEDLQRAWPLALEARLTQDAPSRKLLVEQFHDGLDLRAFVVGNTLVSAIVRVPLHVVGDGSSELRTLLERTFSRRQRHRSLAENIPEVREEDLHPMGLSLSTILEEGQLVILNQAANLRAGGIPVDVTDQLSEEIADLAVDALWSIPGLHAAGIDLLVPDLGTAEGAVVLEATVGASLTPHHFPAYGRPRNVAGAIAEQILLTASR